MRYTLRREAPEPNHTRVRGAALRLHISDVLQEPLREARINRPPIAFKHGGSGRTPATCSRKSSEQNGARPPRKPLEERQRVVGPLQMYPVGMENRSLGPLLLQLLATEIETLLSHPTPPKKFAYATPQTSRNRLPKENGPPASVRQPPARPAPDASARQPAPDSATADVGRTGES